DQHAAHEKVNYERIMARVEKNEIYSQNLNPPIIVSLNPSECITLKENLEYFNKIGFEVEEYESSEFVIRAIPMELYFNNPKDLFLEIIADCDESGLSGTPDAITRNIATMACKASVKGGDEISYQEIEELLDELLTLENPYHCPHGRPTIFSMSKYELEKKFKRIVN
ncbi:MAG TPA: DNA mismatch repair protein MutL, partial [Lachnospiraceae bacterium]|nr:DNA mismatch repair protein MutL [Lachnospiraceae bacterium]